ncbi:MAG: hypothetical protein R8M45_07255 [Ghiorsea sp.]
MNIQILTAVLAVGIGIGSTINGWYRDSVEHALVEDVEACAVQIAGESSDIIWEDDENEDVIHAAWKAKYDKKVRELDIANECKLAPRVVHLWNEAIADATAQAIVDTAPLPSVDPTVHGLGVRQ